MSGLQQEFRQCRRKLRLDRRFRAGQHRNMNESEQRPPVKAFAGTSLWLSVLLAIGGLALATAGCGTFDKAPASKFAAVRIQGNTPGQIRDAAAEVFRDHGFRVTLGKTNLVCEKEGSGMDNFAYGNWMGGEPVWLRVKATIVPLSEATFRLQCLAYKVRDKGSFAFEEEVQVSRMSSRPYRKMFEEVAAKLRGGPPP